MEPLSSNKTKNKENEEEEWPGRGAETKDEGNKHDETRWYNSEEEEEETKKKRRITQQKRQVQAAPLVPLHDHACLHPQRG